MIDLLQWVWLALLTALYIYDRSKRRRKMFVEETVLRSALEQMAYEAGTRSTYDAKQRSTAIKQRAIRAFHQAGFKQPENLDKTLLEVAPWLT